MEVLAVSIAGNIAAKVSSPVRNQRNPMASDDGILGRVFGRGANCNSADTPAVGYFGGGRQTILRFVGSPLSFFRMLWDHEPPLTRPPATLSPSDGEREGVRGQFMESSEDLTIARRDHEPNRSRPRPRPRTQGGPRTRTRTRRRTRGRFMEG